MGKKKNFQLNTKNNLSILIIIYSIKNKLKKIMSKNNITIA